MVGFLGAVAEGVSEVGVLRVLGILGGDGFGGLRSFGGFFVFEGVVALLVVGVGFVGGVEGRVGVFEGGVFVFDCFCDVSDVVLIDIIHKINLLLIQLPLPSPFTFLLHINLTLPILIQHPFALRIREKLLIDPAHLLPSLLAPIQILLFLLFQRILLIFDRLRLGDIRLGRRFVFAELGLRQLGLLWLGWLEPDHLELYAGSRF